MLKKVQVVMLPTNEKAPITLNNVQKGLFLNPMQLLAKFRNNSCTNQHLYILSDEEIKERDWCLYKESVIGEKPFQITKEQLINKAWFKKIIATTDSSLRDFTKLKEIGDFYPQPSNSFLEVYVKAYNEGKQIKQVMVEYEGIEWLDRPLEYFPKVNPKDNTITIKRVKDIWNREEVIELIEKFVYFNSREEANPKIKTITGVKDWMNQNI